MATGLSTMAYEISSVNFARHDDTSRIFGADDRMALGKVTLIYSPYRDGKQPKGPVRILLQPEGSSGVVTVTCALNSTFGEFGTCIEQTLPAFPRSSHRLYRPSGALLESDRCSKYTLSSLGIKEVRRPSLVYGGCRRQRNEMVR